MKKLIITVILITASLLIAPKFIGNIVEQEREKSRVEFNKNEGISLTTEKYTRGWFGADVTSELTINLEGEGVANLTLHVEEEVSFGPVIITDNNWHIGLGYSAASFKVSADEIDENIMTLINENIHLSALLSFDRSATVFIETDKSNYETDDSTITVAPSLSEFTFSNNEHITGTFSWGGLEFNKSGERLVIGHIDMAAEQHVVSGDYLQGTAILTGDTRLEIQSFDVYSHNNHAFSLNDASFISIVSLDDDLLTVTLKQSAKEIMAAEQRFNSLNLDIVLANIDINVLQELKPIMTEISSSSPNEEPSKETMYALSGLIEKLLIKKPNLKVTDLSVVTEEGKIMSELNVTINQDLFDVNNLNSMALVTALNADAKGTVPLDFLAKFGIAAIVERFVVQGYLTKQEKNINFDAQYVERQLTINGKAFQL